MENLFDKFELFIENERNIRAVQISNLVLKCLKTMKFKNLGRLNNQMIKVKNIKNLIK
jgi:hypothetical protein